MRESGVDAALIVEAGPGGRAAHLNGRHLVDAVGVEHRGQAHTLQSGQIIGCDLLDPIQAEARSPENFRAQGQRVFERHILRIQGRVSDAVATGTEFAVAEAGRRCRVRMETAVTRGEALVLAHLVVDLDVELIIRIKGDSIGTIVIEFAG